MSELWDNPLFPVEERLEMAKGGIAFRDKIIANLRAILAASAVSRDAVINEVASLIADNWPDRKYALSEIEAGIRALQSKPEFKPDWEALADAMAATELRGKRGEG
jgi:hypothetical protein